MLILVRGREGEEEEEGNIIKKYSLKSSFKLSMSVIDDMVKSLDWNTSVKFLRESFELFRLFGEDIKTVGLNWTILSSLISDNGARMAEPMMPLIFCLAMELQRELCISSECKVTVRTEAVMGFGVIFFIVFSFKRLAAFC